MNTRFQATITRIEKRRQGNGAEYRRVHFASPHGSFWHTDVVPSFRNFRDWEKLLIKGAEIGNLREIEPGKIDADCRPVLISIPGPDPQMDLFS